MKLTGSFLNRLREARAKRAEFSRVHAELSRLDARELADIGLHPSQIDEIAARAAAEL